MSMSTSELIMNSFLSPVSKNPERRTIGVHMLDA